MFIIVIIMGLFFTGGNIGTFITLLAVDAFGGVGNFVLNIGNVVVCCIIIFNS